MALDNIKVNNSSIIKIDDEVIYNNDLVKNKGIFKALSDKVVIKDDDSQADLNVGDDNGNVIVELKEGHIKTKNFDSRELRIMYDDSNAELNVGDASGNVVMELKKGYIRTKNFDSHNISQTMNDESQAELNVGDESGNVVMELKGGHIKTKYFDSRNSSGGITPYTKLRFANWNIAHFNMGPGITNAIDTQEEYEHYLPIYRKIFNQVNADFISCCEFESPFYKNHSEYTTKRELFPNYQYYNDSSANAYDGDWIAYFSHLPLINVHVKDFTSKPPSQQHRYSIIGDLVIGNFTIKVVCTHLSHDSSGPGRSNIYAPLQMQELIDDFANEQYVIMLADWNTSPSDFQPLKNAGYSLANNDFLGTLRTYYSTEWYEGAMDNIAVKGGSINNIGVVNVNEIAGSTLSDHYLIYCDIVFF